MSRKTDSARKEKNRFYTTPNNFVVSSAQANSGRFSLVDLSSTNIIPVQPIDHENPNPVAVDSRSREPGLEPTAMAWTGGCVEQNCDNSGPKAFIGPLGL